MHTITPVYHGSGTTFDKFDIKKAYKHCAFGQTIWFTDTIETAHKYTDCNFDRFWSNRVRGMNPTLYTCSLRVNNIFDFDNDTLSLDFCPKRISLNRLSKKIDKIFQDEREEYKQEITLSIYDGGYRVSTTCASMGKLIKYLGYDCIKIDASKKWFLLFKTQNEMHYCLFSDKNVYIEEKDLMCV